MILENRTSKIRAAFVSVMLLALFGCGTTTHKATFSDDFAASKSMGISVGEISDVAPKGDRGDQEHFDTEQELQIQLQAKLMESGLLADSTTEQTPYTLNAKITDYDPGSAGKRWLMPGYGATELSVECYLYEGDREVGKIFARRTVEAGGLYTVGAWKGVFETVAEEIVEDLKLKLSA